MKKAPPLEAQVLPIKDRCRIENRYSKEYIPSDFAVVIVEFASVFVERTVLQVAARPVD